MVSVLTLRQPSPRAPIPSFVYRHGYDPPFLKYFQYITDKRWRKGWDPPSCPVIPTLPCRLPVNFNHLPDKFSYCKILNKQGFVFVLDQPLFLCPCIFTTKFSVVTACTGINSEGEGQCPPPHKNHILEVEQNALNLLPGYNDQLVQEDQRRRKKEAAPSPAFVTTMGEGDGNYTMYLRVEKVS